MWNILGEDAIYLDIPYKFKDKIVSVATDDENGSKFKKLLDDSDIRFMINGETEECCFMIQVPDAYTPEEIQFMADCIIAAILKNDKAPVSVDGVEQDYKIIVNNNKEPEIIGLRKTPECRPPKCSNPSSTGGPHPEGKTPVPAEDIWSEGRKRPRSPKRFHYILKSAEMQDLSACPA